MRAWLGVCVKEVLLISREIEDRKDDGLAAGLVGGMSAGYVG